MDAGVNRKLNKEDNILFNFLYDKYSGAVMGFIIRNTNNLPDAEDILIKVFLQVWVERKTFHRQDNMFMKILKIAAKLINEHKETKPFFT